MGRYVVKRFIELVPLLFLLSILVFLLLRIVPGDPLRALVGPEAAQLLPEERAALERQLGLDKSLPEQYISWLGNLLIGDWGRSFVSRQPIVDVISQRLNVTIQLATLSWVMALAFGVPIGIFSALKRNSWPDTVVNVLALAGVATPNFLLGLLLITVFAVYLGVLPTSGFVSVFDNPIAALRHMALPSIALTTSLMTSLIRQTRSAMLEVMNEDYIRTARAKGVSHARVITRHAMKNALLPVVTIAGLQVGNLFSGTVVVETMFAVPGIGRSTIEGVYAKDFALVQIVVIVFATATVMANLVADIVYVQLDPRIRL